MTQPNADKLKGCPFCGGSARMIEHPNGYGSRTVYEIECSKCRISKNWPDKEIIIRNWNTRPSPPQSAPGDEIPESVIEAMARKLLSIAFGHDGDEYNQGWHDCMQAALTAAEAMGYTLTKQDRVLPELPENVVINRLWQASTDRWRCELELATKTPDGWKHTILPEAHYGMPTPREAVLSAIGKIESGK